MTTFFANLTASRITFIIVLVLGMALCTLGNG